MAGWKSRVGKLALLLAGTLIAGCPQDLLPSLSATPGAVDFGTDQTTRNISLSNTGGGSLDWTATEVTRISPDSAWVTGDVPWLTLSATTGTIGDQIQNLTLTASRTGLSSGLYNNTGVQISSNGGTITIPVSMEVEAVLQVVPSIISLSSTDTTSSFTIRNNGNSPLNWSLSYLPDPNDPDTVLAFPPGFSADPATGTNQGQQSTTVSLTFPPERQDFGILISSNSGDEVVVFSIGTGLEGLSVSPDTLRVSIAENVNEELEQPASTLFIENTGATRIGWTISIADRIDSNTAPPFAATPIVGSTDPSEISEVLVRITNPSEVDQEEGRYELLVRSGESFQAVPIVVDVLPLPDIELSRPPQTEFLQPEVVPMTLLDFGTQSIQEQFWIVNVGDIDSDLYFDISHDDQRSTQPLIASVTPLRGNTNGPDQDYYSFEQQAYLDGVPVTVTIDRSALVEDVETRTISVYAFDSTFTNRLSTVEVATIQVRVEKQPFTITGALNRGRPPNLLRYVFSNRDEFGQVVPLQTETDRMRLAYDILEDQIPLDLTETSQFLTYDYRGTVVLMLDYTGSMYNAGTTGEDPLQPGEAVALMREAAATFIDDLPPNFRLQLMYYSDRIGEDRVIQRFTGDRELLKTALQRFNLSPALFGASDIYDALSLAITDIAAEDPPTTLPFDDADVRAIVYITDGEDNVSAISRNELEGQAQDNRVRLFPVAYSPNGDPVNFADLLPVSDSSGGYLYNAGTVRDLRNVLGTRRNMRLLPFTGTQDGNAVFSIRNLGNQAIFYEVEEDGNSPWLGAITVADGVLGANATTEVEVALSTTGADVGDVVEGTLNVTAGNGAGQVVVQFEVGAGNAVTNVQTMVRDEPGTIWHEFNNQSVVTYMTPKETGFQYLITGRYTHPDNRVIAGAFEKDGVFTSGNPLVGQVSLKTSGIFEDLTTVDPSQRFRAEVFVYADYIPRNITSFSFRFFTDAPGDVDAATAALLDNVTMQVSLAEGGILADDNIGTADWRLISDGEGRFRLITDEQNYLPIASFGNMLKLTFTNLGEYVAAFGAGARQPEFLVSMRMDNQLYISPRSDRQPSTTKYFLYPGGIANPEEVLSVELDRTDLASPAADTGFLVGIEGFEPEVLGAYDPDEDSYPNFNDPSPFEEGIPGPQIVPNPFEIDGDITEFTLTVMNSTLDRYEWSLNEDSLPPWLPAAAIRYGDPRGTIPQSTLLPGESETVHFTVNRTGQIPGTAVTALVEFEISNDEYLFFVPEEVPITLVTNP